METHSIDPKNPLDVTVHSDASHASPSLSGMLCILVQPWKLYNSNKTLTAVLIHTTERAVSEFV